MQNHENIEKIKEIKKKLRDELEQLRLHQKIILKQFCLDNGGHYFWDWRLENSMPGHYCDLKEIRSCEACGHREWRCKQ